MILRAWRRTTRLLGAPKLALWLLVFIGVWSTVATVIPQAGQPESVVVAWDARYALIAPVVHALSLHTAFSAPVFVAAVVLLSLSTVVCSWNRTKTALARGRSLRAAAAADRGTLSQHHADLEIACAPNLAEAEALSVASDTLLRLGLKTQTDRGVIRAVSRPWAVWGSPIFHWALVLLLLAAFAGTLLRTEASMSIPVGETLPNEPTSYRAFKAGPWSDWKNAERSVRIDAFDPDFSTGGIDRGAVPTVSILGADGNARVTQRVYPNMKLHDGSLSVNAPGCGLTVTVSFLDADGREVSRAVQLVDFSQEATGGTLPVETLTLRDADRKVLLTLFATVPLDRAEGGYGEWIPARPAARIYLADGEGKTLLDEVVGLGETATLEGGNAVRVDDIGWYSRLSLVDDPTIPFIYAAMVIAALGLTLTLVAPQRLLTATVQESPEGARLKMSLRLWRNNPTSRNEIERELVSALTDAGRGSDS